MPNNPGRFIPVNYERHQVETHCMRLSAAALKFIKA